jgi:hypothetical protein
VRMETPGQVRPNQPELDVDAGDEVRILFDAGERVWLVPSTSCDFADEHSRFTAAATELTTAVSTSPITWKVPHVAHVHSRRYVIAAARAGGTAEQRESKTAT